METLIAVESASEGGKFKGTASSRSWPGKARVTAKLEERRRFDAQGFLESAGVGRWVAEYGSGETIFHQDDPTMSVLYIQKGRVKVTVINEAGREAVMAILGADDFLGEGCLVGQTKQEYTATTIAPSTVLVIDKREMIRALHAEATLSDMFIKHVLSRQIRVEQDLIDQFFNSSEQRLARALLLLARCVEPGPDQRAIPRVTQETLAEMVGTTRSRVNFFMNKFRKLGFIKYNDGIHVNVPLLCTFLHDSRCSQRELCDF